MVQASTACSATSTGSTSKEIGVVWEGRGKRTLEDLQWLVVRCRRPIAVNVLMIAETLAIPCSNMGSGIDRIVSGYSFASERSSSHSLAQRERKLPSRRG